MENLGLNWVDAFVLGVVLLSAIMAFARGLLREMFSIVALIAAGLAAYYGHPLIAPLLSGVFSAPLIAMVAAMFLIFIVVFIAITVATSVFAKAVHQSAEIGALDRFAGLAFGVARAVLILGILLVLLRMVTREPQAPMPTSITSARTYPVLEKVAEGFEALIPKAKDYIKDKQRQQPESQPSQG